MIGLAAGFCRAKDEHDRAINRGRGVNLSQFVNEYRVRDACDMLAKGDASVLNVSLAAGFATKSNFNREFQRVTGKTPSEWRLAVRDISGT